MEMESGTATSHGIDSGISATPVLEDTEVDVYEDDEDEDEDSDDGKAEKFSDEYFEDKYGY